DWLDWQTALVIFAAMMLLILPLSLALATPSADSSPLAGAPRQSLHQALSEAFGHRSYMLLVLGFFTCWFPLAFITVHLPASLFPLLLPSVSGPLGIDVVLGFAGVAVRLRLLLSPGRRFPRRVARRASVRSSRLIRHRLVALGLLRRGLRPDQPADRRETGAT